MNKPIYIYVKHHNKTGMKYLGKTIQDPYTYKGSGKYWKRHLKKHGNDVSTEVIFQSYNKSEIKQKGIYFSKLWEIVESDEWANLKSEEGDGGFEHINDGSDDHKERCRKAGKKRIPLLIKFNKERILNKTHNFFQPGYQQNVQIDRVKNGTHPFQNKFKKECPHCGKQVDFANYARHHGDNCKFRKH